MNKEDILKNLSSLTVEEIVDAIIKGVVSLEDLIRSEMLSGEKLSRIKTLLQSLAKRAKGFPDIPSHSILADEEPPITDDYIMADDLPAVLPLPLSSRKWLSGDSIRPDIGDVGPKRARRSSKPLMEEPLSDAFRYIGYKEWLQEDRQVVKCKSAQCSSASMRRSVMMGPVVDHKVYSAVYAPSSAELKRWFKVPVFLYNRWEAERVYQRALEMDGETRLMEKRPLSLKIKPGTQVEASIDLYDEGVRVSETTRHLMWDGTLTAAVFLVMATEPGLRSVAGKITISTDGIPLGEFSFNTDIVDASGEEKEFELCKAKSFRKAFISYAHDDVDSARTMVNILHSLGFKYFYDRTSLLAGDLFEERIMKGIEESDIFVLLWSKNAAQSAFVEKEYLHALPLAYPPKPKKPTLVFKPFFVDHPHAEPPAALQKINFVDLY